MQFRVIPQQINTWLITVIISAIGLLLNGCNSTNSEVSPDAIRGAQPAVMVSIIGSSPGPRTTYVGAFSDVPTGQINTKNMLEFGNAYFYSFDGSIFVWDRDAVTVTRYEVSDQLKLTKGATISFANYGFKYGADLSFISPTRAYMIVSEQNQVITWDPSKMEISGKFSLNLPSYPNLETFPIPIGVSGNNLYLSVFSANYNDLVCYPKNVVAIIPTDKDGPVTLIEDSRTLPGLGGYVMTNGDIYLVGDGDAGNFSAYGPAAYPSAGILRIKAGQTAFDPSYFVNLETATNSPGIVGNWRIDQNTILARVWDSTTPLPKAVDSYFASQNFISKKVDLTTGKAVDFPALVKGGFSSNIQDFIDNKTYFPLPNSDGSADIAYRLSSDGIQQAYTIPGAGYWGMRRIR
jgi:hypothetical protein